MQLYHPAGNGTEKRNYKTNKAKQLPTDRDTFTYETKTEIGTNDLNEVFHKHKTKFDFSNYSTDWKFYDGYR